MQRQFNARCPVSPASESNAQKRMVSRSGTCKTGLAFRISTCSTCGPIGCISREANCPKNIISSWRGYVSQSSRKAAASICKGPWLLTRELHKYPHYISIAIASIKLRDATRKTLSEQLRALMKYERSEPGDSSASSTVILKARRESKREHPR